MSMGLAELAGITERLKDAPSFALPACDTATTAATPVRVVATATTDTLDST